MKVAYCRKYVYSLPPGHRFPMEKYSLLEKQLRHQNIIDEGDFFEPDLLNEDVILLTHTQQYLDKLNTLSLTRKEERAIGFPVRKSLIDRGKAIANGTIQCALYALGNRIGMNTAGGTHHAFSDHGEGFCVFNDFAVASNYLLDQNVVGKILIVDLDVHQGNGTAHIFQNENRVFTFSMHGANNYPLRKEESDLDIPLPDQTSDTDYLEILSRTLPKLIHEESPDLIFYLSGVDVIGQDKLGRLGLTIAGCRRRDDFVFTQCAEHDIPVAVSMGGGYASDIKLILEAHTNTYKAAVDIFG